MLFLFDNCVLDSDRRELRYGGEPRHVEPQVFDLLEYLIRNRNHVVTKDDLLAAVWRGRIVSEATVASRISAARAAIGDDGDSQRLIRTILRKGARFVGDVREQGGPVCVAARQPVQNLIRQEMPSIAVLPFQNMGRDAEQEHFADGIVEEIITALSRLHWVVVTEPNLTFICGSRRDANAKPVSRELGVRYFLAGSVRHAANRVRINTRLVDAGSGTLLWAERFEGALHDIFELQDHVAESVVGTIGRKLEQAEIERARHKCAESLDAYDYYLRGLAELHRGSRESTSEALEHFYRAIELDAEFASAYGMAALCYDLRKWNGWIIDRVHEITEAERLARAAAALGKDDAVALCTGGFALAHAVGELEEGAPHIERALELNPNLAIAWHFAGWIASYCGEPDIAIERVSRAMRLSSSLDPFSFLAQGAVSFAHIVAGRYDEAMSWAQRAVREQSNFAPMSRLLASSSAMAGRPDEAQRAMARMRELDPTFRISDLRGITPLRRPDDLARYEQGLRQAGLPE